MDGMKIGYRTGEKEEIKETKKIISENVADADDAIPKSEIANPKSKKPGKKKGGGKN